jgi:hypothetical protein
MNRCGFYLGVLLILFLWSSKACSRQYDPATGRFLQEDSSWDVNLYGYVYQNPVYYVDPDGRDAVDARQAITAVKGTILGAANSKNISAELVATILYVERYAAGVPFLNQLNTVGSIVLSEFNNGDRRSIGWYQMQIRHGMDYYERHSTRMFSKDDVNWVRTQMLNPHRQTYIAVWLLDKSYPDSLRGLSLSEIMSNKNHKESLRFFLSKNWNGKRIWWNRFCLYYREASETLNDND